LQNQLETGQHQISQLQSWQAEIEHLHQTLEQESYGKEIRAQLDQIDADLSTIGYSDKDHALARAELERWRWVESKRSDLQKAQQRQQRLQQEIDKLQSQIQADRQTDASDGSQELAERLQAIDATLKAMPYTVEHHQTIRWQLRQAQAWLLQRDALLQARQQLPGLQAQCDTLIRSLQQQRQTFTQQTRQLESLHKQLAHLAPVTDAQLKALVTGIEQRRQQQDQILSRLGAVEQRLHHLAQLESEQAELGQQLQHTRRHYQVHQELATAFGRNGIPALIIENVLPELEAEANQILSKLTANQLHIQFITQRSGRRSAKLIDTLDIVIADPQGTRPYETYSGGEAFRINFAIRLALSRLLAQRAGARLQTLMIDEGFGTQDQTGRQQLVAAINAVASDFACILVITHIPSLRDAFPTRIEVERTPQGSRLSVQG
jgi:exonuclease SbcC